MKALPKRVPNEPDAGMKPGTGRRVTLPFSLAYVVLEIHSKPCDWIGVIESSSSVP